MRPVALIIAFLAFAVNAHAAGTVFSAVLSGSGEDFACAVASDAQGNTYVAGLTYSPDFPTTPGAFQPKLAGTDDAFVAKVGPDGKVIWSTYLGGILDDWATGVAVDSTGNVWVTGYTRSANFPLFDPIQSTQYGFAAFVTKLDPTGSKLLYSTFLGGTGETGGVGIVTDSAGNAYIAANTLAASPYPGFPQTVLNPSGIIVTKLTPQGALVYSYFYQDGIAQGLVVDSTGAVYVAGSNSAPFTAYTKNFGPAGNAYAIVFKISPDGSTKVFDTALGGSVYAVAAAIAVDSAGEVWVAGATASADFPTVNPLESSLGARPLWMSTNSGSTWTPLDNLPFALPQATVVDPATPTTIYEATGDLGVFKSVDGGATWKQASSGLANGNIQTLAINPVNPQILFAAGAPVYLPAASTGQTAVYKSLDGANTWVQVDMAPYLVTAIEVDPLNPGLVYEVEYSLGYGSGPDIRKSTDGGNTWSPVTFPAPLVSMVLDPHISGTLVAVSSMEVSGPNGVGVNAPPYFYRSVDGGADWTENQTVTPIQAGLLVDGSTTPSTVYDGLAFRSSDVGVTWTALPSSAVGATPTALAVDPSGTLYASNGSGVFASHDRGQTFTAIGAPTYPNIAGIVPDGSGGTLFAALTNQLGAAGLSPGISTFVWNAVPMELNTSGFVSKLSADGQTLEYSTYLRGHPATNTGPIFTSQPAVFQTQNWISGIALDSTGNVVVAGGTRATDFATVNPAQAANAGRADAFAAILSADGSALKYSTYFGGSQDDGALGVAIDSTGNVIIAGQTMSVYDFPITGGIQPPAGLGDAFVVKLATGPPAITSVVNGASYQPGIEAGSWVMITGVNLANTTRTWNSADFNGVDLPTSLSGISVTIDGKPAFPYYISPTQINVQAPTDSATGAVSVVVDNNGALSVPAMAQLQTAAPAFFLILGTSVAVATNLNYVLEGTPSAPAHPGDTLVLWATGFGPTTPPAPAGVEVSGAPATATPVVSVGGMPAQVISSLLTTGTAGLYQITIQLPANVPSGTVAVQASIGGAQTPPASLVVQ